MIKVENGDCGIPEGCPDRVELSEESDLDKRFAAVSPTIGTEARSGKKAPSMVVVIV